MANERFSADGPWPRIGGAVYFSEVVIDQRDVVVVVAPKRDAVVHRIYE